MTKIVINNLSGPRELNFGQPIFHIELFYPKISRDILKVGLVSTVWRHTPSKARISPTHFQFLTFLARNLRDLGKISPTDVCNL